MWRKAVCEIWEVVGHQRSAVCQFSPQRQPSPRHARATLAAAVVDAEAEDVEARANGPTPATQTYQFNVVAT